MTGFDDRDRFDRGFTDGLHDLVRTDKGFIGGHPCLERS